VEIFKLVIDLVFYYFAWLISFKLAKKFPCVGHGNFLFKNMGRGAIWVEKR